jgi:serine/threonine protein kinase
MLAPMKLWLPATSSFSDCNCQIKRDRLIICRSSPSDRQKIPFSAIHNVIPNFAICPFCFELQLVSNSSLYLIASSMKEMQEWIVELLSEPVSRETLTLDSFEVLQCIYRGMRSEIFLVEQKATGDRFALKSMFKHVPALCSQALSERNVLMKAKCPFVLNLIASFQSDRAFHFVIDFLECGSLKDLFAARIPISLFQSKLYLCEISLALSHLHHVGFVYRNLMPEHVLVGRDGHIKLIDFSQACEPGNDHPDHTLTPYSAPESVLKHTQGFGVDWWALGVLAFELFTGRPPFRGASANVLGDTIVNGNAKIPPATPIPVADFLSGLLQKNPPNRLGANDEAEIFGHELFTSFDRHKALEKAYQPELVPDPPEFAETGEERFAEIEGKGVEMPGFSWNAKDLIIQSVDSFPSLQAPLEDAPG